MDDIEDKGIDLDGSLSDSINQKEYEKKDFQHSSRSFQSQTPKVIELVIKYSGGFIKNKTQAYYTILGLIVISIVLSFFLLFSGSGIQKVDIQDIPVDQR